MSVDEYGEEYPFLIAKKNTCSYRPNEWLTWIRSWLEIKHPLGLKKGGKILDVGCCIGDWANGLSKLGLKVTGVDVNMSALRFGKTKYSGINLV